MTSRVHVVLSCLLLVPALLTLPGSAAAATAPVGTVVSAPVLTGPEPPPAEALRLRHVHASSSWYAAPDTVATDLRRWRRTSDVVTMTESAGDAARRATLEAPGWSSVWFAGSGPRPARRADASVQWRDAAWVERARATLPLSDRAFPVEAGTERGITSNATAVVLEHRVTGVVLLVTVAHLPSLVERPDGTGFDPAPGLVGRVAAYDDALAGYRAQVARLTRLHEPDVRLVVADWNVDAKRPWARAHLRRAWAGSGLVPAWPASYDGPGTFEDVREGYARSRLIDGTLVDAGTSYVARPRVLAPVGSTDHRPYAETLRLPGAPGETGVTPLR